MATEYKLSYTAAEIDERLLKVAKLSEDTEKLTADTTKLTTDTEKLATDMQNKAEVVELTTAEYEALEETNFNTLYMLTDGEEEAVVQYTEQILADEQKAQARKNIGAASSKLIPYTTPQMYGAVGNGTTDDTEAFVRALADCKTTKTVLLVPAGTYLITDVINIDNIELWGMNPEKTVIHLAAQKTVRDHVIECWNNVIIKDIQFRQSFSGRTMGLFDCHDSVIENCIFYFEDISGGALSTTFDMYRGNTNIWVRNCKFLNRGNTAAGCVMVRNAYSDLEKISEKITFDNCEFEHASKDECLAVWGWKGIVRDVVFRDCRFEDIDNEYFPSSHFITLGMDGDTNALSQNYSLENCKIYHNRAKAATIKSAGSTLENININNCYFEINAIDGATNYSFYASVLGVLRVNNCTIKIAGHTGFSYVEINDSIVETNAYLAIQSVFNNSAITFTASTRISEQNIEFNYCVIDFCNIAFAKTQFQPTLSGASVIINGCTFKNHIANSAGYTFQQNNKGASFKLVNSTVGAVTVYSNTEDAQVLAFGNIVSDKLTFNENIAYSKTINNNLIKGMYCSIGTSAS